MLVAAALYYQVRFEIFVLRRLQLVQSMNYSCDSLPFTLCLLTLFKARDFSAFLYAIIAESPFVGMICA